MSALANRHSDDWRLDPRTKLLLLLLVVLAAMLAPSLSYELALVALIGGCSLCFRRWAFALKGVLAYTLVVVLSLWVLAAASGVWRTMLIAFFGLVHKVYPCGMLGSLFISTTRVGEFMAAMQRLRVPKRVVIPLAVMLRYLPTIREDWRFIKDAMRLRDVMPSLWGLLRQPMMTVECLYVPLMMAASKAADELSVAAVTRGIEDPRPRTSLVQIGFGWRDALTVAAFAGMLALAVWEGRGAV